jgi:hypothetical protein
MSLDPSRVDAARVQGISMRYTSIILSTIILPLLITPVLAQDFTYKDYMKASEAWRRDFVFGISEYMSAVAQQTKSRPIPYGRLKTMPRSVGGYYLGPARGSIRCS